MKRRERPAPRMTIRRTPPVVLYRREFKSWLHVLGFIVVCVYLGQNSDWCFREVPA